MKVPTGHFDVHGPRRGAGSDAISRNPAGAPSRATKIARLSAGVVAGGVTFDKPALRNASASPSDHTLSLHAAPADRNTAATGVALGRVLDVTA